MDPSQLQQELAALPEELLLSLREHGFDAERLVRWSREVGQDRDKMNRLSEAYPPDADDVVALPDPTSDEGKRLIALGDAALARGEVALLVLAGGMATRMGGVVKALVEALPGKTFLDLRLGEKRALEKKYGRAFPLWMMTSDATHEPIKAALANETIDDNLALFQQHLSLRLTTTGELFRDDAGQVSIHPTGHGDLPDALRDSGLLQRFRARGGKYVLITNLDNLGASIDPIVVGRHIDARTVLTCEVVEKAGDKGGIPIKHHGKTIICEDFRLPIGFDATKVNVFNTNTFFVNADALDEYNEPWTYCEVEKKVGGKPAIQRERLVGELTFHLATRYVKVPREGERSRFLPVKDPDELARRRNDIEHVARSRGMLE